MNEKNARESLTAALRVGKLKSADDTKNLYVDLGHNAAKQRIALISVSADIS